MGGRALLTSSTDSLVPHLTSRLLKAEEALLCLFMNSYGKTYENLEYILCAQSGTGPLRSNKRHNSKTTCLAHGPNISVVYSVSCTCTAVRHTVPMFSALQECNIVNLNVTTYKLTSLLSNRPSCRMGQSEQVLGAWSHERLFFLRCRVLFLFPRCISCCVSPFSHLEY